MMRPEKRYLAAGFLILTISIVLLLASGISGVEFQSGIIQEADRTPVNLVKPAMPNLMSPIFYYILLFSFWVILPLGVVLLIKYPWFRKLFIRRLYYLSAYGLVLFLVIRKAIGTTPELEEVEEALVDATVFDTQIGAVEWAANVSQPDEYLNLLIGIGLLLIVAGMIWYAYRKYLRKPPATSDQLKAEIQDAIHEIQAGADLRNIIIRCYAEMSQILNEQRGIQRQQAMTPREFEAKLQEIGLPQMAVHRLTRLFEEVRYGQAELGPEAEQEALHCLTEIAAAC